MSLNPTPSWLIRRALLTVLFWIGAILILLYMAGLRVNFAARTITATSSISISLINQVKEPIEYILNGQSYSGTTPVIIGQLTPGSYTLTIRQAGRVEWHRSFKLAAGEAANFKDVLLVPSLLTPRAPTDNERALFDGPAVITGDGLRIHLNELYLTEKGTENLLLRLSESITQAIWLPKETHILLLAGSTVALVEHDGTNLTPLFTVPTDQPVQLAVSKDGGVVVAKVGETMQAYDLMTPHGLFWFQ